MNAALFIFFVTIAAVSMMGCHKNPVIHEAQSPNSVTAENTVFLEPEAIQLIPDVWKEPPIAKSVAEEIEFPHCGAEVRLKGWYRDEDIKKQTGDCHITPEFVQKLIDSGADVNQYNEYGQTPLMLAADISDVESVKKLLAAGAIVHHTDDYDRTVFDYVHSQEVLHAIMQSGKASVRDLNKEKMPNDFAGVWFYYGAFDDYQGEELKSIKSDIIWSMDIHAAKRLVSKGWLNTENLRAAFINNAVKNAELLAYAIENVPVPDKAVYTNALMTYANEEKDTIDDNIIHLLQQAGADIDRVFAETRSDAFAQQLQQKGAHCSDDVQLVQIHNVTAMKDAIQRVSGVKDQLKDGRALFEFTADEDFPLFSLLIEAGANVHAVNEDGNSLLHRVYHYDDENIVEFVELLLKAGLSPNVTNKDKRTPLFDANSSVTEVLLEAGADVNAVDAHGESVVSYFFDDVGYGESTACFEDQAKKLQLFVDYHARDLDSAFEKLKDNDHLKGYNFHDASELIEYLNRAEGIEKGLHEYYDTDILLDDRDDRHIREWLKAGHDPNSRYESGSTKLFYVSNAKEARILLAAGADANVVDNDGNTPLLWILSSTKQPDCEDSESQDEKACDWNYRDGTDGIVRVLLEAGADTTITNKAGKSVKDY